MQKTLSVIDLRAIRTNALKIKSMLCGRKFFAVVKADAYGHGAEEVAKCIEDVADGFCVAIAEEGEGLRIAGITKPVLVFAPPLEKYDAERARFYDLTQTVNCVETARLVKGGLCHIKINTGMNRLGCSPNEFLNVLKAVGENCVEGIYSHLYAAENERECEKQLALFENAESVAKAINPEICSHLAASGGLLRGGKFLKDGARCGILLYGYAPSGFKNTGFKPAMKVYARKTQETVFLGGGMGYNIACKKYGRLSTYRLGYADGFFRNVPLGEKTLCMDAFIREGSGDERLCVFDNADEYSARAGTISYEALCSVTRRSERIYER